MIFRFKNTAIRLIAATAMLCGASSSLHGILASVKATGMGGVGVAYPQDAMAGVFNPAGIVDVCDRVDFGVDIVHEEGNAKIHGNIIPPQVLPGINGTFGAFRTKNLFNGQFGIIKSWCLCDWELSTSFVFFNRSASKTTYSTNFPLLGTSRLGMEYIHESGILMAAMRYCDFSFGIGAVIQGQRLKVNGLERFDNPLRSVNPGFVTNKGYDYSYGVTPVFGVKYDIIPCYLSVGASIQPKTKMSRFKKYKGFVAQHGRLDIAPRGNIGIHWQFMDCASVNFDVEYIAWQKIKSLHNPVFPNALISRLGSDSGAGFGLRSQTFYRFGVDWDIDCNWTVRAGFRYARCFFEPKSTAINVLTDETANTFITIGTSYRWNACTEISAYYAHGFKKTIKGHHSIPEGFPPRGFGGGEVDLTEQKDVVGVSFGWFF